MPATPNFGLRYPALTDPPNGPAQIEDLADDVDAALVAVDARLDAIEGNYPRGIIAYAERNTVSPGASSSADVGALRIDNIPITSGRTYVICLGTHPNSTVLTDTFQGAVRGSTSGVATTSSPVLRNSQFFLPIGTPMPWRFTYRATVTGNLSILLCLSRFIGSGTCSYHADGVRNTEMWVESMGPTVADTGVDL